MKGLHDIAKRMSTKNTTADTIYEGLETVLELADSAIKLIDRELLQKALDEGIITVVLDISSIKGETGQSQTQQKWLIRLNPDKYESNRQKRTTETNKKALKDRLFTDNKEDGTAFTRLTKTAQMSSKQLEQIMSQDKNQGSTIIQIYSTDKKDAPNQIITPPDVDILNNINSAHQNLLTLINGLKGTEGKISVELGALISHNNVVFRSGISVEIKAQGQEKEEIISALQKAFGDVADEGSGNCTKKITVLMKPNTENTGNKAGLTTPLP